LKKPDLDSVTKKDMQIQPEKRLYMPTDIVVDGKLVQKNLKELNLSKEWVIQQIKQAGANSVEEIFLLSCKVMEAFI
jgi:uncharacterized membrane protein YcaP (DUF421 family)